MKQRLQKVIASSTAISRRKADGLIQRGRVVVNGKTAVVGMQVDPAKDDITVQGKPIQKSRNYEYLVLHKPEGYVSTRARFKNEESVYELLKGKSHLAIAGRLDKESSGLLLLTNDGNLIQQITHPSFVHEKEYLVSTSRALTREETQKLKRGVRLEEGRAAFDKLSHVRGKTYRVIIHQGWKRQIRRMFKAVHVEVAHLRRVRVGKIRLGSLPQGKTKHVKKSDIL